MLIHALTSRASPWLRVWRDPTDQANATMSYDVGPRAGSASSGNGTGATFRTFEVPVDYQIHQRLHCLLHDGADWERPEHQRDLPRVADHRFPGEAWIVEGTSRVLIDDPAGTGTDAVTIHLITAQKYRKGRLYLWLPGKPGRYVDRAGYDDWGPYFAVLLSPAERRVFAFKFVDERGEWEPEYANKLWASTDGGEVWVHSRAAAVSTRAPVRKTLGVNFLGRPVEGATMHLWQEDSDFVVDLPGASEADGWLRFETTLYTGCPYRFLFRLPGARREWEHEEAKREIRIDDDREVWTLEGDRELFAARPVADRRVVLEIGSRPANNGLASGQLLLDVWVNQGELPIATGVSGTESGTFEFHTYPDIVTSFRFRSDTARERIDRHYLKVEGPPEGPVRRWVVLDRADVIPAPPAAPLFQDPAFPIERPGAWVRDGMLRFALHCPSAASVQ